MEISLNPNIERLVSRQVQLGRFPTAADVIESAVLLLTEHEMTSGIKPTVELGGDSSTRHSPRGLLADLRSNITSDDIKEARYEMWAGITHGEA